MPITGIAEITYGVDDLDKSIQFYEDWGLTKLEHSSDAGIFEVISGQRVNLYKLGDSRIPKSELEGFGVHECVWAVPSQADLDRLVADLSKDHDITTDDSGTVHFVTAFGQAIGLKVFNRRPVTCSPSPTNSPGNITRLNTPRKWPQRPVPKAIAHIVWGFLDIHEVFDFYRDRLGFRLSDIQEAVGMYIRAGGTTNHHSMALADAHSPAFGFVGKFEFHHVNFTLEDVDEMMVAKNYLERKGYKDNGWGLGRHRVSSELFLYYPNPAGGEAEFGADCDQCDEQWRPRVWGANFAAFTFTHDMPEWLVGDEPDWNVRYAMPEDRYQSPKEFE